MSAVVTPSAGLTVIWGAMPYGFTNVCPFTPHLVHEQVPDFSISIAILKLSARLSWP